jgi:pimeloyl-ACP methyl ester carboxylesterase
VRKLTTLAACLTLYSGTAWAIDGNIPTITSAADILSRRSTLITQAWGTSTLPTTQPTVTAGISNPFPSFNVSRVDQYVASMSNGQTNTSNLYIANSPNNGRVVILNPGHQNTCDWTAFSSGYRISTNTGVLQGLLAAGYSVFAFNMPNCGNTAAHGVLFSSYGNTAMSYFFEPAVQAMNYWDANNSFSRYDMVGLSGGGWTTAILPALDLRIKISIPVAGSWPGMQFIDGCANSDEEQCWSNWYTVAGYIDLYIMASYGPNRRQFQILNFSDDCCFGNSEFSASGGVTAYGVDFATYMRNWVVSDKQLERAVMPFRYDGMIDYIANQHQISTNAQSAILSILALPWALSAFGIAVGRRRRCLGRRSGG